MGSGPVRTGPDTRGMAERHTDRRFVDEVPRLLEARRMSIRQLARLAGVTDAHLSRVLRGADYKSVSESLARRVAISLELPEDYFPEVREAVVIERVRRDGRFRDELYQRLQRALSS